MQEPKGSVTITDRLRDLLSRLEEDDIFRGGVNNRLFCDWLATKTDEEQAIIMNMFSYLIPPPTRTDNGDGTYTYTWKPDANSD